MEGRRTGTLVDGDVIDADIRFETYGQQCLVRTAVTVGNFVEYDDIARIGAVGRIGGIELVGTVTVEGKARRGGSDNGE